MTRSIELPPSRRSTRSTREARLPLVLVSLSLTCAIATPTSAQVPSPVRFSIDFRSPTIGEPDAFNGIPISEGDVLVPATSTGAPAYGPLINPGILIRGRAAPGASLGLLPSPSCSTVPTGPCGLEVDALSFGVDQLIRPGPMLAGTYVFSVDLCSRGIPGSPLYPNVLSESASNDHPADVFEDLGLPGAPLSPTSSTTAPRGNSGIIDGDGLTSPSGALYPGVGLLEPGVLAVIGDNLDAVDLDHAGNGLFPVYFSLDGTLDDQCWSSPGSGSAQSHGFQASDVLVTLAPGTAPQLYAGGWQIGLDQFAVLRDDLDALALHENGVPGYQPSRTPFDWFASPSDPPSDMLLFSVRRGSRVVGLPDSIFGLPIEPGDILTTPQQGGMSQFPGIFIAAEWLGLRTNRFSPSEVMSADLDALDTRLEPQTALPYCFGTDANCPCGNGGDPGHGCANSAFAAGGLLVASGSASVSGDSVSLTATSVTSNSILFFQGTTQMQAPFGDGLRCAGGNVIRLGFSNPYPGPGDLPVSVKGAIGNSGGLRTYQAWYRNAAPFCTSATFNLTNGLVVIWTP